MSNKQSSVYWLDKRMTSLNFDYLTGQVTNKEFNERSKVIFEKAKAMHKEEILKTYQKGYEDKDFSYFDPEQYYNETFEGGNK